MSDTSFNEALRISRLLLIATLLFAATMPVARSVADEVESFTQTGPVIYREKHGVALTLDVLTPNENANGAGVIVCHSGGWGSQRVLNHFARFTDPMIERGYTVFTVVHGSQPNYTIPEIVEDIDHAVRFVRHNAERFGIDPDRLAIFGGSSGGHLSLMQGTAGSAGDPDAKDPVERASSRVQAVGVLCPPTDLMNFREPGDVAIGEGHLAGYAAAFDFREFDEDTRRFERITDTERRHAIGRSISPINHVTPDDPPTLIVHGKLDRVVPLRQGEIMIEKLKAAGVDAKLVILPDENHFIRDTQTSMDHILDWFDKHL